MARVRLSIGDLIAGAYREVYRNAGIVFTIGLIPCSVGAMSVYTTSFASTLISVDERLIHGAIYFANQAVVIAMIAIVAVAWHRFVLLGEKADSVRPSISIRHVKFWVWSVLLTTLTNVPEAILGYVFQSSSQLLKIVVGILAGLVLAYLEARIALILPATAIERLASIPEVWKLSSGNGFRIAGASMLVMVPLFLVLSAVMSLVFNDTPTFGEFDYIRSAIFLGATWTVLPFVTCIEIGVLSQAYREISGRTD